MSYEIQSSSVGMIIGTIPKLVSPRETTGLFSFPGHSSSSALARIPGIASGAMVFVVMTFVQGDLDGPQPFTQNSFLC